MNKLIEDKILDLLGQHRIMTLATLRPDGWPQATTVGYAFEGLTIYFLCGPGSQKAHNLARDDRVSLTIDHDTDEIMEITGLSMAGHAHRIEDPKDVQRILGLLFARYSAQASLPATLPAPDDIAVYRITPVAISVLDYRLGFGHTDLVMLEQGPTTARAVRA